MTNMYLLRPEDMIKLIIYIWYGSFSQLYVIISVRHNIDVALCAKTDSMNVREVAVLGNAIFCCKKSIIGINSREKNTGMLQCLETKPLKRPYVAYADTECYLLEYDEPSILS